MMLFITSVSVAQLTTMIDVLMKQVIRYIHNWYNLIQNFRFTYLTFLQISLFDVVSENLIEFLRHLFIIIVH
jgi:hypothetical protein